MLYHGNYRDVLSHVTANLILTSPPYNIGSKGTRRDGNRPKGGYDPKSYGAITEYEDNLPEENYQEEQLAFLHWAADHLAKDGVLVYNHKPRRKGRMIHPAEWFLKCNSLTLMEEVIWDRGSTHNHDPRLMWPHTERLYVFIRTDDKYCLNNRTETALPQKSDVWRINRPRRDGHNCSFPIELARAAILAWSRACDIVCDPYAGACTTGLAALELGRRFIGAEILKKYYNVAMERLEEVDG